MWTKTKIHVKEERAYVRFHVESSDVRAWVASVKAAPALPLLVVLRESPWRGRDRPGSEPDHGGASRAGRLTWTLVLRCVRGRQGLLHQVSVLMNVFFFFLPLYRHGSCRRRRRSAGVFLSGGVTGVCLSVSVWQRRDADNRMAASALRWAGELRPHDPLRYCFCFRFSPVAVDLIGPKLYRVCCRCRPTCRMGGRLHGRRGQLLHKVRVLFSIVSLHRTGPTRDRPADLLLPWTGLQAPAGSAPAGARLSPCNHQDR